MSLALQPHPRLYVSAADFTRATTPPPADSPRFAAWTFVVENADAWLASPPAPFDDTGHNSLLMRARATQTRVLTLLLRWRQTGDGRYRTAALGYIRAMASWEYWSWITRKDDNPAPDAIFDLSYGENCATLAIAWDWLHVDGATLSPAEEALFLEQAEARALKSFRRFVQPAERAWWFGKKDTNWNTVCAGGAGMLVLALAEHLPDAAALLEAVEASIAPYFASLVDTDGGWPEGIGYWNYGMRYGFMYLLSRSAAEGQPHPLLRATHVQATLAFPPRFCPNGVPCSFGDVNHWSPLPFHFAAAVACDRAALLPALDAALPAGGQSAVGNWPGAAEILLLHPGNAAIAAAAAQAAPAAGSGGDAPWQPACLRVRGLDWMTLGDREHGPQFYLALRSGSTEVPHGHIDLLSFHCVVGDESMVLNVGPQSYLDTTFSSRRYELTDINATTKNGLFLNGVGAKKPGQVTTTELTLPERGHVGYRLDATGLLDSPYKGNSAVAVYRAVMMLAADAMLIVDRVIPQHPAMLEARFHTRAAISIADRPTDSDPDASLAAVFRGVRQALTVRCAATVPSVLQTYQPATTFADGKQAPIVGLRHLSPARHTDHVFATLLVPGDSLAETSLRVVAEPGGPVHIDVMVNGIAHTLSLSPTLE